MFPHIWLLKLTLKHAQMPITLQTVINIVSCVTLTPLAELITPVYSGCMEYFMKNMQSGK